MKKTLTYIVRYLIMSSIIKCQVKKNQNNTSLLTTQQPCYIRAEPTQGRQCRCVPLIGILFDNDKITTE